MAAPTDVVGCAEPHHLPAPAFGARSEADSGARVVAETDPVYPSMAREANVDGRVEVMALVCEHGRVVDARVVRTDSAMLSTAAMDCVRHWSFEPARANGQPVPDWTQCFVHFNLK
ncbi:MAG TPA: energy transducer TonB [Candidatus Saccharimonadaceae bacterium]|nr:energy transducer TonB [Candidatus Saccharimonadaceae bacterium]